MLRGGASSRIDTYLASLNLIFASPPPDMRAMSPSFQSYALLHFNLLQVWMSFDRVTDWGDCIYMLFSEPK